MTLEEIKKHLKAAESIAFELPDGQLVPEHFHVTEVGKVTKHFIDCGGIVRLEEVVNFQLWEAADDYNHRLHPEKLVKIINLSQDVLDIGDLEIEVEYQGSTIGKYGLEHNGQHFILTSKQTDCLAREKCGVPQQKPQQKAQQKSMSLDLSTMAAGACTPGGGCC